MKKLCFLILGIIVVFMGISIFDYQTNNRYFSAALHTVSLCDYQEQMTFSAPITRQGHRYLMSGAVRKIDNITVGALATVNCGDETYKGNITRLEPTFDGIYYVTVAVTGLNKVPQENATAVISGNIRKNLIFIPAECLVTDASGQDAVYVVQDGYAMLRTVKTGTVRQGTNLQILHGIFPAETLVISPQNIRTGDCFLPP